MTENDLEDIGSQLKTQREKLGYSLQNVAQHTRIRRTYLESIENNQFADLPGHAYVTGFVKAYARYLGADTDALLAQLESIRLDDDPPSLKPINTVMRHPDRLGKKTSRSGSGALVLGILGIIVLCGAIYLLTPMFQMQGSMEVLSDQIAPEKGTASVTGDLSAATDVTPVKPEEDAESLSQEAEKPSTVASKTAENEPLPPIPPAGAALRMLALSEGSLIIHIDGRDSHTYKLHDGLDLVWDVKKSVKVELTGPGIARFWLGEQLLYIDALDSFQLQTTSGD